MRAALGMGGMEMGSFANSDGSGHPAMRQWFWQALGKGARRDFKTLLVARLPLANAMPTAEAVPAKRPDSGWAERRGGGARTRAAASEDSEAVNRATGSRNACRQEANGMRWNGRDRTDAAAVWTQAGATTEDQNDEGQAMAGGSGVYNKVREREQQIDRVSEEQLDSSGEGGATTEGAQDAGAHTNGR